MQNEYPPSLQEAYNERCEQLFGLCAEIERIGGNLAGVDHMTRHWYEQFKQWRLERDEQPEPWKYTNVPPYFTITSDGSYVFD